MLTIFDENPYFKLTVMMDCRAPTLERRKLVKTWKKVLPVDAKVCGETYSKNDKKIGVEKRPQTKRGTPRQRERDRFYHCDGDTHFDMISHAFKLVDKQENSAKHAECCISSP